ncbi:MAG TPA: hypothetical protein VMF52_05215 [Steroidobacteraceae bacterium]|nr:hypothetical protein [Steroidobacteraceae bacterium]
MSNGKTGQVSMMRDGVKYVGYWFVEGDVIKVSTETGTMSRPIKDVPVKELASQLLAKLVHEEIKSLK